MSDERVKPFLVPDLGEGLEEVTVTHWNVAVGDDVELNQVLCTVETAKAEVELPSPYAGRIVEMNGAEGDVLKVGAVLVRLDTAPESGEPPAAETAPITAPMPGSTPAGGPAARWPPHRCASWPRS